MGVVEAALAQVRAWSAFRGLAGPDPVHDRAIATLVDTGAAAFPCLRYGVKLFNKPRMRFGAAVALHKLGDAAGLDTIVETLQYKLTPSEPEQGKEVEAALIRIGAPDAVTALVALWPHLLTHREDSPVLGIICRVWSVLRDPRSLTVLAESATRYPNLFLQTAPAFGEFGVIFLGRMAKSGSTSARVLAVNALGRLTSDSSIRALTPLLRDSDPEVRGAVPVALEQAAGSAAAGLVAEALFAGYSSRPAVELLIRHRAVELDRALIALVERWETGKQAFGSDTSGAVATALTALPESHLGRDRIVEQVAALLKRTHDGVILASAVRCLGICGRSSVLTEELARTSIWPTIAHASPVVRAAAAESLSHLHDSLGTHLLAFLETCRPQEATWSRLIGSMRQHGDPATAAAEALTQVSRWIGKVSRETAARLVAPQNDRIPHPLKTDARVAAIIPELLSHALEQLENALTPADAEEAAAHCLTVLRAVQRLHGTLNLSCRSQVSQALRAARRFSASSGQEHSLQDMGEPVRAMAAETILEIYPSAGFPLLVEGAYAADPAVRDTAIVALGTHGDPRSIPILRSIVERGDDSPCVAAARAALEAIRRRNPEMMTLLRASSRADATQQHLLRAVISSPSQVSPDLLLRPSSSGEPDSVAS